MPESRLGEAWLFRKSFESARNLLEQQDDWCEAGLVAQNRYGSDNAHLFVHGRFPERLEWESLVALLRGSVKLNVHCYEVCCFLSFGFFGVCVFF